MEEPRSLSFHAAGVLALDIHPRLSNLIASGSMDHSVSLGDISASGGMLCTLKDHEKFVVRLKWSPSGNYLVTASYDKSFILYKFCEDARWLELLQRFPMAHPIEALAFKNFTDEFVVSIREENYLFHYKIEDFRATEVGRINLNALGDDHVSFTALDVSFSPDDRLILVSTDKQHQLLIDAESGRHLGVHYGFLGDELSQPRHCWHPSGFYFYETCQDKAINVVRVSDQTVIHKLIGHTQLVRHLWYSEAHNVLVSSSFDGSVRLWKC